MVLETAVALWILIIVDHRSSISHHHVADGAQNIAPDPKLRLDGLSLRLVLGKFFAQIGETIMGLELTSFEADITFGALDNMKLADIF